MDAVDGEGEARAQHGGGGSGPFCLPATPLSRHTCVVSALLPLPGLAAPFPVSPALGALVEAVVRAGGRPLAVGGAVRDHLRGLPPKDIDLEVYGLPLAALERALAPFTVHAVGRAFGVLKVDVEALGARECFDVALPRRESKAGRGHKGFVVESDPSMTPADAALRRDFTVNAIAVELGGGGAAGALVDPSGGVADLQAGVLRHVSAAFDEDPLRVLRGAQFAARFSFEVAPETVERCRALCGELNTLPKERVWGELGKLLVRGVWPSAGLHVLWQTGALAALFPEVAALVGCAQEPEWHPEGDVWTHTLLVVDEAAQLARRDGLDDGEALRLVLGALCHDLGKPLTTAFEDGRLRSKDHEAQGEAPTRALLDRIGAPHDLVDDVVALVREHLKPFHLYKEQASDAAVRRLALRVPLPRLVRLARADHLGRTTDDALAHDDPAGEWLLERAAALAVADAAPKPMLLGRHLLARGLVAGPALGALLKEAFEAQLDGRFADEAGALAWLEARLRGGT
ncbi:MAG: HD domain-containing protein [Deltaproteobacteria bacterium]|nr:HD domain-containing protein [Deltaproteobacteria bacterium]